MANVPALLNLWPQTGRILGLPRGPVFRAAARGDLPTVRLGKRIFVSSARLAEQIGRPITPDDLA
jgi:hypothetical protein